MAFIIAYALVFIFAAIPFFEVLAVIPLGILAGLNGFLVIILAFLGNLLTVLLVIFLGDRLNQWNERRKAAKEHAPNKRRQRAERLWKKYGLIGFSLLGPVLIGSHLAAFLAVTFGGQRQAVTLWMTISLVVWCIAFGVLSYLGADFILERSGNTDGFLYRMLDVDES
ncbi:small multi-drug export protein [Bacillaceae bacterium SIJ1]|uniref:small multi-drug export protein n=1 Tax=Litoribacterium kuwaitense TaxID=1398745 RepID=UPI0013ED5A17|nr:small multi-drug export protein [Litoribacterium kuwaitense]NGP45897.1 small multi-drug export protein [Litoribacterium kuwaitense]